MTFVSQTQVTMMAMSMTCGMMCSMPFGVHLNPSHMNQPENDIRI